MPIVFPSKAVAGSFLPWVEVVIEVPRGSLIKRDGSGRLEFVSPFPCPMNYGSVTGWTGADCDPLDAVVLGRPLARGRIVRVPVRGAVGFVDDGIDDLKLVCSLCEVTPADRRRVLRFFRFYAVCKRWMKPWRRAAGPTICQRWRSWSGG